MTLESTDSVTRAMVKSGLRICGSADVHIDKLELNFIFRLRASVRVRIGVEVRVSISIYLIAIIKLRIGNVFTSTKLGWRKFRRRISEFIAMLAEFSPVIILLDRRQFCQCRAYENAATAENRP